MRPAIPTQALQPSIPTQLAVGVGVGVGEGQAMRPVIPSLLFPAYHSQPIIPNLLFPAYRSQPIIPNLLFPASHSQPIIPNLLFPALFPAYHSQPIIPSQSSPHSLTRPGGVVVGVRLAVGSWRAALQAVHTARSTEKLSA